MTFLPRKPMISARWRFPSISTISAHSPIEQGGPSDSTVCPFASTTRPVHLHAGLSTSRAKYGDSNVPCFTSMRPYITQVSAQEDRRSRAQSLSIALSSPTLLFRHSSPEHIRPPQALDYQSPSEPSDHPAGLPSTPLPGVPAHAMLLRSRPESSAMQLSQLHAEAADRALLPDLEYVLLSTARAS